MFKLLIIILLIAFVLCNINEKQVERLTIKPSSVRIDTILFVQCLNKVCVKEPKKDVIFDYLKKTYTNIKYTISPAKVKEGMLYFYAKNSAGTNGNIYITYTGIYSTTNITNFLKNHSVKKASTIFIRFKNNTINNDLKSRFDGFKSFIKGTGRKHSVLMSQNLGNTVKVQVIMYLENKGMLYYSANDSKIFNNDIPKLTTLINNFKSSIESN